MLSLLSGMKPGLDSGWTDVVRKGQFLPIPQTGPSGIVLGD